MRFRQSYLAAAVTHAMWHLYGRAHIPLIVPGMATYGFNRPLYLKV